MRRRALHSGVCCTAAAGVDAGGADGGGGGAGGRAGGSEGAFYFSLSLFKNRWFLVRRAEVSVNWVGLCWWLPANDNNRDRGECEQQRSLLFFSPSLSSHPSEKSANRRTVTTAAAVLLSGQPAAVVMGDTKHPTAHLCNGDSGPTLNCAPTEHLCRKQLI